MVFVQQQCRPSRLLLLRVHSISFITVALFYFYVSRFYLDIIHYYYVRTVAPDQTAGGVLAGVTPCPIASVCIRTLIRAMPVSTRYYLTGRSLDPRSLTFSLYSHFPVSLDNKLRYILPSVQSTISERVTTGVRNQLWRNKRDYSPPVDTPNSNQNATPFRRPDIF